MNAKEGIEAIKKILFGDDTPAVPVAPIAPVALATDYKLADGTAVQIDKLEVGGLVMVAGVPAPDGVLELEDGTTLTVLAGAITELGVKATEPTEPAEMGSQFEQDFAAFKVEFESHKAAFDQVKVDFAAANDKIVKQDEAIKGLLTVVENLAKVEVASPAQTPVDFESMSPLQKFRATK